MEYGIVLPTTRWPDCALSLHIRVRGEERTSWLWVQLWRNFSVIDLGPGSALVMWTQHSTGITQLYWIEQHLRSSGNSQGSLPSTRVGRFSGFSEWDPVESVLGWVTIMRSWWDRQTILMGPRSCFFSQIHDSGLQIEASTDFSNNWPELTFCF